MREKKVLLSREKGAVPKRSMLDFEDLAWNIADGKLFGKALDESGNEVIVQIGGQQTEPSEPTEPTIELIALNSIDGGFSNSVYLVTQSICAGNPNSTYTDAQILSGGNAVNT